METATLFDRLGGREGIRKLTEQVVANHYGNPLVGPRFTHAKKTQQELVDSATEFFCTGLSGIETYKGESMPDAHAGMNVSAAEFIAVLDDVMLAMGTLNHGDLEKAEVLKILYDMKPEIISQ